MGGERVLDLDRSVTFYRTALGLEVADRFDFDGFTLVYLILAIIEVKLLLTYIRRGAPEDVVTDPYADAVAADKSDADKELYFAY